MSLTADAFVLERKPLGPPTAAARPTSSALDVEMVGGEAWDRTVAGFAEVCQEQLHGFALIRWPGVALEPLLFRRAGEVVGGVLMMIQTLPLGLARIAIAKWGRILADQAGADDADLYAQMIEAMVDRYARQRRMFLSIWPHADLEVRNRRYEHLIGRGFRPGARLLFPNRYIIKLRLSDEAQRRSFEQKWRYHLKKAEKAQLGFEHAGPERIAEFAALYERMLDRKRFADHSAYDTVPALMTMADERLRPEVFFVRHEGEVVAGALIFKAGERAVYLYGATADRALPLRAGYFLHWNIIRWLRDNTSANWYDLGGTDGFHGLHQFKKGMAGSAGVITPVPPVANFAASRLAWIAGSTAFALREFLHQALRRFEWSRKDTAKPDQALHKDAEDGESR
jgi:hypothetical protein